MKRDLPGACPRAARWCALLASMVLGCGSSVVSAPSDGAVTDARSGCPLPGGGTCPIGVTCPAGDGCNDCSCTPDGMLACTLRACVRDAGRATCASDRECPAGSECIGPEGCAVPWTCVPSPGRACTDDLASYCSCTGATVQGSSSCPPTPFVHRGPCRDAGATTARFECNPALVTCRLAAPTCGSGRVPSVSDRCWGFCVPFDDCEPIPCEPGGPPNQCPANTTCWGTTRRCGPFVR